MYSVRCMEYEGEVKVVRSLSCSCVREELCSLQRQRNLFEIVRFHKRIGCLSSSLPGFHQWYYLILNAFLHRLFSFPSLCFALFLSMCCLRSSPLSSVCRHSGCIHTTDSGEYRAVCLCVFDGLFAIQMEATLHLKNLSRCAVGAQNLQLE